MRHKMAYANRDTPTSNQSPRGRAGSGQARNPLFESGNSPQDVAFRQSHAYFEQEGFAGVKKLPEETEFMRQTMNSKLARRLGSLDLEPETERHNKFEEFLRQTMSFKSLKHYNPRLDEEIGEVKGLLKTEKSHEGSTNYQFISSNNPSKVKSTGQLLETSGSGIRAHRGQNRLDHRRIIQELKGPEKKHTNLLKNVSHSRSPTYIDLDSPPETNLRSKLEDTAFHTPKNQKPLRPSGSPGPYTKTQPRKGSGDWQAPKKKRKAGLKEEDFEQGRKLGEGKFGVVRLARHKVTGVVLALKRVPKAMIREHRMIDQMSLEVRLQSCISHRNILTMYGFFQDPTYLFIVLEYMDGGTLYDRLKRDNKMTEEQAAIVIRQVAEAVDYLHDRGIVHRDIKPENVVISNGVYKLCDFGWAALCDERRKTYCGTFDYVPPEILEGVAYDMTVDLWCLGVMTYELLTGKAPFYHVSRKETMKRILNVQHQQLVFPEDMTAVARDFIEQLIRKDPKERLKAPQVLAHAFLSNLDL